VDLVLLVHRDSPAALGRSCEALAASVGPGWEGRAILVENAAPAAVSSAAREAIRTAFPAASAVLVRSRRNLGAPSGVNLGISQATAPLVGVFNPDGLAEPETVPLLAQALERNPEAFVAVASLGDESRVGSEPERIDWARGGATLYRRDAFLELGGYDPLYFLYAGDSELSQRARRAGWALLRVPLAHFRHGHGDWGAWLRFNRTRLNVISKNTWSYQYADSRPALLRLLARKRASWFAQLARRRDYVRLAGALVGMAQWPARIPRIEYRRRHPWDGASLDAWLVTTLARCEIRRL
jgi:GT2 family glycosyltransferase